MDVSSKLSQEKYLGINWKTFNKKEFMVNKILTLAEKGEIEESKHLYQESKYPMNLDGFAEQLLAPAVLEFTKEFVRKNTINQKKLNKINYLYNLSDSEAELILSQPNTYLALEYAAKQNISSAKELINSLNRMPNEWEMDFGMAIVDIVAQSNQTPYTNKKINEDKNELSEKLIDLYSGFMDDISKKFKKSLKSGAYISPVNECNMSLEQLSATKKFGKEVVTKIYNDTKTDFLFYLKNDIFYIQKPKTRTPEAYVGNPKNWSAFASFLDCWSNCHSFFDPAQTKENYVVTIFMDNDHDLAKNTTEMIDRFIKELYVQRSLFDTTNGDIPLKLHKSDNTQDNRYLFKFKNS
jgi:hypothetical protein